MSAMQDAAVLLLWGVGIFTVLVGGALLIMAISDAFTNESRYLRYLYSERRKVLRAIRHDLRSGPIVGHKREHLEELDSRIRLVTSSKESSDS